MYGFTPIATIEKLDRPPPENRSISCRKAWLLTRFATASWLTQGYGHDGQGAVDDQHPQHEEDAAADVRRAEGVDEGVEHPRLLLARLAAARSRLGRRLRLGDGLGGFAGLGDRFGGGFGFAGLGRLRLRGRLGATALGGRLGLWLGGLGSRLGGRFGLRLGVLGGAPLGGGCRCRFSLGLGGRALAVGGRQLDEATGGLDLGAGAGA